MDWGGGDVGWSVAYFRGCFLLCSFLNVATLNKESINQSINQPPAPAAPAPPPPPPPPVRLTNYLFICLFVHLFICLFVYLFICFFVYLFFVFCCVSLQTIIHAQFGQNHIWPITMIGDPLKFISSP